MIQAYHAALFPVAKASAHRHLLKPTACVPFSHTARCSIS